MVEFAQATVPAGGGTVKTVVHGGDENLYVEFYKNPEDGKDHIKMRIPGDKHFAPDFLADERYQRRFPQQWEAYQNQNDQFEGQTRLEEVAWINEGMRHHLQSFGVFTIDALAKVIDGNLSNIGHGARELRERAKEHLATAQKAAAFDTAQAEKAELQGTLEAMQKQMAEMQKQLAEQQKPKRRGRQPKAETAAAQQQMEGTDDAA